MTIVSLSEIRRMEHLETELTRGNLPQAEYAAKEAELHALYRKLN